MRHVATTCVAILLTLGLAASSFAQHTMPPAPGDCGCHHVSTQPCDYHGCCPPLLPSIGRGIHNFFHSLMPCCGCNNHRVIYHEALRRNGSRGRCCLPCLPLISFRNGCGCGHDPCGCGPTETMHSEPLMETYEDPAMMPPQPVPSSDAAVEPIGPPPQADQGASANGLWKTYPASQRRSARGRNGHEPTPAHQSHNQITQAAPSTKVKTAMAVKGSIPRSFSPDEARQLPRETTTIRTVSGTSETAGSIPNNPLR